MKLSIIIPAYNEEKRILPVLENYYSFFKKNLRGEFEIIVIPNNCLDNTSKIVKNFASGKKEVSFFEIKEYSGKGGAVMKGFELAKGELIGFVDADESTSPEEFFKLYKNIGNNSGIIGSRKIKGAKIIPKRSFLKNFSSFGFHLVSKVLFGLKYKDTQCGAKIFRSELAKYFVKNLKEKGWIFDVEILFLCKLRGHRIKEFPILWREVEGTHLGIFDGVKSIFKIINLFFKNPKHRS